MPGIQEAKRSDFTKFTRMNRFGIGNDLKGVFAKNERGYRLNAIKKRF